MSVNIRLAPRIYCAVSCKHLQSSLMGSSRVTYAHLHDLSIVAPTLTLFG